MKKDYNQEEIFWSRVNQDGPTMPHMDTNCWVVTEGFNNRGYGKLPFSWEGRKSHRYSYYLNVDQNFDRSKLVCHHCDNPPCVRPSHLFLGTAKDNGQDMSKKGRSRGQKVTHCPQGHEYTKENTFIRKSKARQCLTCKRKQDLTNHMKYYYQNHEKSKQLLRERYARKKASQCA